MKLESGYVEGKLCIPITIVMVYSLQEEEVNMNK